jgi:PAS domain S-box-containing protein
MANSRIFAPTSKTGFFDRKEGDALLFVIAMSVYGLDLLLPAGRAIIVLLIIVIILAGRSRRPQRVIIWTAISLALTVSGYPIRHGMAMNYDYLVRRGICLLACIASAYVSLRNQWLQNARRDRTELLERAGAAIFVTDLQSRIISWSKGAELLYGWASNDVLGRKSSTIFGDDDSFTLHEANSALASAGKWHGNVYRKTSDGRRIFVLCNRTLQKNSAGEALAVLESNTDVTEHKVKEAEIRSSEEHFRGIFEMAGAAIWEEDYSDAKALLNTLKADGIADFGRYFYENPNQAKEILSTVRVIRLNVATTALLQAADPNALQNRRGAIILRGFDGSFSEFLAAAAEGRKTYAAEIILSTLRGETRNVLLSVTFEGWEGENATALLSAMDITERKNSEYTLVESKEKLSQVTRSAALGELTTLISRQIEKPIAQIIESGQLAVTCLRSETPPTQSIYEILRYIIQEARRCSGVVGDVRSFLKRNQKTGDKILIPEIINAALPLLERDFSGYNITMNVNVASGLPEIPGETGWLEYVILYMMLNRVQSLAKSSENNRILSLSVFQENGNIVIRFQGGPSVRGWTTMDFEEMPWDADHHAKNIGLTICRVSVEARGGHIVPSPASSRHNSIDVVLPI